MTETSENQTMPGNDASDAWLEQVFARSEPALTRLGRSDRIRRLEAEILARAERQRARLRIALTVLMLGALGILAWLLTFFGSELASEVNTAFAPWRDMMLTVLILSGLALGTASARTRAI